MRSLSNTFKWVGASILALSLLCGLITASETESVLVFIYWAIGGGFIYMNMLAYGYFLEVAADIKDRLDNDQISGPLKAYLTSKREEVRQPEPKQTEPQVAAPAPVQRTAYKPTQSSITVRDSLKIPGVEYVVCDKCGFEQRNNRTTCYRCGAPFSISPESTDE